MAKKITLLLLPVLLHAGIITAQEFDWVRTVEIKRADSDSPFPSEIWSMDAKTEADPRGNIFLTGNFKDTLAFGTQSVYSKSGFDFFIAKYDANGSVIWIKQFEGSGDQTVSDMDVDRYGNIYLTGLFSEELKFGEQYSQVPELLLSNSIMKVCSHFQKQ